MNRPRLPALLLAALVSCLGTAPALAQAPSAAQARNAPRAELPPAAGEVIVKFKSEAATVRRFALGLRTDGPTVQALLAGRAAALGQRVGRGLQAGHAVGERSQVMRAEGVDTATLVRQLAADPEVEYAVPNGRRRALAAPNDPLYSSGPAINTVAQVGGPEVGQWYLRAPGSTFRSAIDIEPAWARGSAASGVVVAVLDTGVRFEHPDLGRVATGGVLLPGYDFVADTALAGDGSGRDDNPEDPGDYITAADTRSPVFSGCEVSDSSWHGTSTASLVAALTHNGTGMAGTAPGVKVLPVRVLGKCYGYDSDIVAAMRWAAGLPVDGVPTNPNPAKVLNMSLGSSGECTAVYQDALREILAAGAVVVAAAGNSAGGPVGTPANCEDVIAVLALRHVGTKVGFSDLGQQIAIAAPGGNCVNIAAGSPCLYPILAASNAGTRTPGASTWSDSFKATVGTSFSSPLVAGVAGLMMSASPPLSPAELRLALARTARPFPNSGADNGPDDPTPVTACHTPTEGIEQLQCYCSTALCGAGMLDAAAAVAEVVPLASLVLSTTTPTAGSAVEFSARGSAPSTGGQVVAYSWQVLDGGGIANGFTSATNADTASLTPAGAGNFTVQLTVTDSKGRSTSATRLVTVTTGSGGGGATPPAAGGGGGGGAASWAWVLGVLAAALALRLQAARGRARG